MVHTMNEHSHQVSIERGTVITPWRTLPGATVLVEGTQIKEIQEASHSIPLPGTRRIDATGCYVAPGYIDIHMHGAAGYDGMDATPQAIDGIARYIAAHGVTGFLPTTVTAATEAILAAIENAATCAGEHTGGARVLGVHVEGPFINPRKPGAQSQQFIQSADPDRYLGLFAWGNIRLITLAPEIPENKELIEYAVQRGVTVAVGHSTATYDEVLAAVRLGLSHATHTFNAMQSLHHREPGTVGAVLACDEITAEVIADYVHLHPAVIKLLLRAKGVERTVLITDAMRATGLPDGTYGLGTRQVTVKGGEARIAAGNLAGSTLTMDRAVRNAMAAADLSLAQAVQMASYNPARAIGIEGEKGSLEPGKDADIVLLDDGLRVVLTMVGGKVVYQA